MTEHLMGAGNTAGTSAYLEMLKIEWQEFTPEIRTGNLITDMIAHGKKGGVHGTGLKNMLLVAKKYMGDL